MNRDYLTLGDFNVSGTNIRVSDPCYDKDTWCAHVLRNMRPGTYEAHVAYQDDGFGSNRVAMLVIRNKDGKDNPVSLADQIWSDNRYMHWGNAWDMACCEVGVDSGQCGFYDEERAFDDNIFDTLPELPFECNSKWYANCCAATDTAAQADVIGCGVVSSSGWGDGAYPCFVHRNKDGVGTMACLLFM